MDDILKKYVIANQDIIQVLNDRTPGHDEEEKYFGTLDHATARFNTILIKLSQDQLKLIEHKEQVDECFNIIRKFYDYTIKYTDSKWFKWYYKTILHGIGTRKIPAIKQFEKEIMGGNNE